jgi:hypothetical protein
MKHGYLKGHKVAECQDGQAQLMARFLREGVVDEWRASETPKRPPAPGLGGAGGGPDPGGAGGERAPGPRDAEPPAPEEPAGPEAPEGGAAPEEPEARVAVSGPESARPEHTEAKPNGKAKQGKRNG